VTVILAVAMPKKVQPGSEFGERLAALRKARGLTQTQLAEKIGSSQRALSRYEAVADRAPAPVLAALAKALRVTRDELLGVKPLQRASINGHGSGEDRRLWKKFQQEMALPEKDRRAVIRLVNSLVETKGRSASGGSR
jgi:transcriptional regulator with XRE-family HTH domain